MVDLPVERFNEDLSQLMWNLTTGGSLYSCTEKMVDAGY
jgi:hypothetical protein